MVKNKKIVLFIEWATSGRDFDIDLPLMYFFERYLGWEAIYVSIFNLPKILSINPDLVIMSNTTGGVENVNMARLIERSAIPFFSHISEGIFRESDIEEFVWGWNKSEKRFSELLSGVWSKKSFDMAIKAYPEVSNVYKVSGAIGFDKYTIYSNDCVKTGVYSKVIGYAGFDFNNIRAKKDEFIRLRGERFYKELINKSQEINEILKFIVKENPGILFLFKAHPGDGSQEPMEFKGLQVFGNVKIVEKEVGIVQAISSCDIWLNYNSTTNLEAWLLNKPTISFNTDETRFSSDIIYGAVTENDKVKLQDYIDEFYHDGIINNFEEKEDMRKELISDYIGFSDGMNHVRFMSFLKGYIDKIENDDINRRKWKVPVKIKVRGYVRYWLFLLAKKLPQYPILKRWRRPYNIFVDEDFEKRKQALYNDFDKFYAENECAIKNVYKNWSNTWKDELGILK